MSELLGKKIFPTPPTPKYQLTKLIQRVGLAYSLLAVVGGALLLSQPKLQTAASNTVQSDFSSLRTLGDFNSTLADGKAPVSGVGTTIIATASPCAFTDASNNPTALKKEFNTSAIFPILPSAILTSKDKAGVDTNCSPPYWNLDIFRVLLYKGFGLLNYVIEITAVIMTIYAGILYLSGFANEKNVATAKTLLIATYTGLIISLSATLILRTTIGIFADSGTSNAINQNEQQIFHGK